MTVENAIHFHVQPSGKINVMLLIDGFYHEGRVASWPIALMILAQYERSQFSVFVR